LCTLCSTDNLDFIKENAIKAISRLLSAKPEGEQALLAAPVNKKISHCLGVAAFQGSQSQSTLTTPILCLCVASLCSTDNLDFIKEKAIKAISRLLSAKPEGEQALLAALVNKLGDPSRKLASDAAYLLGQLLLEHPAMKPVVVREVREGSCFGVSYLNH
jgi:hypothetical protein